MSPDVSKTGGAADARRCASRASLPEELRTVPQRRDPLDRRLVNRRWARSIAYTTVGLALLTPVLTRLGTSDTRGKDPYRPAPASPVWPMLAIAEVAALSLLPEATVANDITAAPRDTAVNAGTAGLIAHNRQPVHVYTRPGGPAIAWLSPRQASSDTWLPVIDQQPGWVRVLLPSHANGATGWLTTAELDLTVTPSELRLHRRSRRLQLFTDGTLARSWRAWPGTAETPTPVGRTFVLAGPQPSSPARVLVLGMHGPTPSANTGSFGTVSIHLSATSVDHCRAGCGTCICVPPEAMDALTDLPLGSLVRVYR